MSQKNMTKARKAKNDEFYTRLEDIEKEVRHYRDHFRGKIVYCNCDDPYVSDFVDYFSRNFEYLGLKKLIASCYRNTDASKRTQGVEDFAVKLEYEGGAENSMPTLGDFEITPLKGDGDFRSQESIDLLKESDIVVTNPPFSLFREYVDQLMEYKKSFLIIGNMNAITYKEIFPLIKDDKIWQGVNWPKEFTQPNGSTKKFGNVCWFTNLNHSKRNEGVGRLTEEYNPTDYPTYDNYDAIEVSRVNNIPRDYDGVMAVPITFLDKYSPAQFEILGIMQRNDDPYKTKKYTKEQYKNANDLNARGVIMVNNIPKSMYARVLIRRRRHLVHMSELTKVDE